MICIMVNTMITTKDDHENNLEVLYDSSSILNTPIVASRKSCLSDIAKSVKEK